MYPLYHNSESKIVIPFVFFSGFQGALSTYDVISDDDVAISSVGTISYENVDCNGSEDSLSECAKTAFDFNSRCSLIHDVAVTCACE